MRFLCEWDLYKLAGRGLHTHVIRQIHYNSPPQMLLSHLSQSWLLLDPSLEHQRLDTTKGNKNSWQNTVTKRFINSSGEANEDIVALHKAFDGQFLLCAQRRIAKSHGKGGCMAESS